MTPGALFVIALLYYMDDSGVFLWVLLASLIHELGHCWAVRVRGGEVRQLEVSCGGAELTLSGARPLPPVGMILAALAGPAVNFLTAVLSAALARRGRGPELYLFAGINLGLALFNLLPAGWLDGGRVVEHTFALLGRREWGIRLAGLCSEVTAGLLLAAGLVLLWQSGGHNFTLLITGLWMAAGARRDRRAGQW